MGSSGSDTPAKASKPTSSSNQERPSATTAGSATPVFPDWSTFQAYSPIPHPGFFHSPAASSPQVHPYMWGAQPIMPPYGTTPPYVMYPPGGLYTHPSLPPGAHPYGPYSIPPQNGNAEPSGNAGGAETDVKSSEGKDKSPLKRSRGSLGSLNMITGKSNGEQAKSSGTPVNGAFSQSGESGSESSSEGSDANSQNDSMPKGSGELAAGDTQSSQNGQPRTPSQASLSPNMAMIHVPSGCVPGPATNLNIGMECWPPAGSAIPSIHGKVPPGVTSGAMISTDQWIQDERELKRQKRKQSNRESARRSRLRKQAECEELAQRADVLKEENATLRAEVNRIRKEYEELLSKNASLKEKLVESGQEDNETSDKKPQSSGDGHQKLSE